MIFTIKKLLSYGLWFLGALLLMWVVGFGLFTYQLYHEAPPPDNLHSDAIVVLTGGDNRVKEGLRLLKAGVADKLLISGVWQNTKTEEILYTSGYPQLSKDAGFKARITLGRAATNTRENAEETHAWVLANNVHSIRMVTGYYHMPRSWLEFHALMPGIEILQHPVYPNGFDLFKKDGFRFGLSEYHKYIAVLLRQAGLWPSS